MRTRRADRKRDVVAAGIIADQPTDKIAAVAGCTPRRVQQLAADPETLFLVTEALRPHRKALAKLTTRAIYVIGKALLAKKEDKADHVARLRAVERLSDLLLQAQGKPPDKPVDDGGVPQLTWEEYSILYQTRRITSVEGNPVSS